MARRTKLAGGYLALCCVFMAFTCVSSVKFYNSDHYIKRIAELLDELQSDLTHTNVGNKEVNGIRWLDMEYGKSCPGTILDIFKRGTNNILKMNFSPSVRDITKAIDHCVTKLWGECQNMQKQEPNCKYSPQRQKVIDFVKRFWNFSQLLRSWNTCGKKVNREYDLREEEDHPDETISICGKH